MVGGRNEQSKRTKTVCVCVCVCVVGRGGEGMVKRETKTMRAGSRHNPITLVWISFSMPILEVSALWNSMVLFERLGTD